MVNLPSQKAFYYTALQALHNLGGSATNQQIYDETIKLMRLSPEQIAIPHKKSKSMASNRIAWSMHILKSKGLFDNPKWGHWILTPKGWAAEGMSFDEITAEKQDKQDREESRPQNEAQEQATPLSSADVISIDELFDGYTSWRDALFAKLNQLSGEQMKRFFLLIFEKEGITGVETLDASHPDEIEGTMKRGRFLTFRVAFKFVRANAIISAYEVDVYRQSVRAGRADKGLLITTGKFTQEAIRDARHERLPIVELIDGEQLIDKLKELKLGLRTERVVVERVVIDESWFDKI